MRKIRTRFTKDLGLSDAVLLGIGFIIGSGIFLFPIIMAGVAFYLIFLKRWTWTAVGG